MRVTVTGERSVGGSTADVHRQVLVAGGFVGEVWLRGAEVVLVELPQVHGVEGACAQGGG